MFELDESAIDAIIFAMEDQDSHMVVDLSTGKLVPSGPGTEDSGFAVPPPWSSREGYHLMEGFLKTVRNPAARNELLASLNRGRGVFKAFKASLASFPDVERAFHEYKAREMHRIIAEWYDDAREANGLARLGQEPDETQDLIADDLGIHTGPGSQARRFFVSLLEEASDEALAFLPETIVACESEVLKDVFESQEWLAAWIEDGEGGAIAGAAALREQAAGRSLGRVVFVHVLPDFRRAGIGRSLFESLSSVFKVEGTKLLVLDSAFLPMEFAEALQSSGLSRFGARGYFKL